MCGYINGTREVLISHGVQNLLTKQKHRGVDGFGAIAIYEDGKSLHTKSMESLDVVNWIELLKGNPFIFIHHRATSVGGTKLKLAHPLEYNDTILMQNGTNKDPYNMVTLAESDSEALAMLADGMDPYEFDFYILMDVGVIVLRKDGEFYLHRDASRPLVEHTSGLLCSEPLIAGEWKMVKEDFYKISYANNKLEGLEYYKAVTVPLGDLAAWCSTCKARHLKPTGMNVCNICALRGLEQKKESPSAYNHGYADDYYDDDYADAELEYLGGFYNRKASGANANVSATRAVYTLIPLGGPSTWDVLTIKGVPVKSGDSFYVVAGVTGDKTEDFKVVRTYVTLNRARWHRGGYIPKITEDPKELETEDFLAYWDEGAKAYDVINDIYYENSDILGVGDMDILVYDKYMDAYIVPYSYNYMPESYQKSCDC